MLVLTRKCSELIQIGDDIVIKVIKTGRNTVKIGIEAPRSVRVARGEVLFSREVEVHDTAEKETPSCPESAGIGPDESDHQPARVENLRRVGSVQLDDPKSCLVC
ncbi:MAG: carbon storage regulator [Planctomycetota bacterium]|nr:carbon storage regulator [Planctomycetota bacterium]